MVSSEILVSVSSETLWSPVQPEKKLQSVVVLESLCVPERRSKEVKQVWTEEGGGQVQFFKVITGKTKKTKDTFSHDAVTVLVQSDVG